MERGYAKIRIFSDPLFDKNPKESQFSVGFTIVIAGERKVAFATFVGG